MGIIYVSWGGITRLCIPASIGRPTWGTSSTGVFCILVTNFPTFLPVAAPWLKVSETVEFAHSILPRLSLPIHDAILSAEGKALVDSILTATKVPGYVRPDLLTTIEL